MQLDCRRAQYGRRPADGGRERPALPPRRPREHGNGVPDPVDVSPGRVAGALDGLAARAGLPHGGHGAARRFRSLNDPRLLAEERLAIVLGTEGDGLAQATIDACDYTVRIPMSHGVDSLNVAAASAVAFYQLGLQ